MINQEKLEESIVLITSAKKANVIGTGFAFYREQNYTYLITCAHVVDDVGGEENVRVNNKNDIPVDVVAIGNIQGFDLAVLKVKDILTIPLLQLMILSEEEEINYQINIPGHYLYSDNKIPEFKPITGIISQRSKVIQFQEKVVVWELKIEKGKLQGGYSGAPVVDLETGFVVGVTTHKEGRNEQEGKVGRAISIEALEKIWSDIPPTISQQLKRKSSLTQLLVKGSNFNNISPASFPDLDFSGISPETIQKAYQNSLPPDAEVWDLEVNNISQILENMHQFRRLPQFFQQLIQSPDILIEIRNQLQEEVEKLAPKKSLTENTNKSSKDFFSNLSEKLDSYILATLIPDQDEYFFLNAWLIIDDSVQNISKFQSLLDSNEKQQGILCNSTQIPKEFNKFLKKALKYLRGKNYSLTIEFFLPSNLMCEEVDRWKISDPVAEEITLGIKYPIRLRSLERLNLDYLDSYLPQWYEYWDKVKDFLPHKPTLELFEHLAEMESFNWKLLKIKLEEKIGLKVTCAHSESMRKDLFRAILSATTPIAIWLRNDIPNLNQVNFIDEILTLQPLNNLCKAVKNMREEADANAQIDKHLGYHLAVLWENPYRLTPDIMVELIAPGQ
ncbi:trypsin-like peptidase domain-containing protein [Dapis sp. BLCC M229]|uniref:VMAP-C domain-containing protein n=1 Tax=Dapis sp. BLCC M229 TaxID=3400188 RepID=UPI003CEB5FC1